MGVRPPQVSRTPLGGRTEEINGRKDTRPADDMDADPQAYAKRLQAEYDDEAPEPPADVVVPDVFWYIHFKAFAFLRAGPDEYRKHDALQRPPANLPATRLDAIKRGCEQILQFRGLSPDRPLEGIGVDGFYALLRLFHFALDQQAAFGTGAIGSLLDQMKMKHVVDGRELTLYNLVTVKLPSEQRADRVPCPYCGELLRTAFAKQCRSCGMDWHDPANAVNRKASSRS
jgi:hypothetical protein